MENNSCIMMNCSLYLPVSLSSIFNVDDLEDTGIETEPHITILYAQGKEIYKNDVMKDFFHIFGDQTYGNFINLIKNPLLTKINENFELSMFSNDSDFIVLKMKKSCYLYNFLKLLNSGLRNKYDVPKEYTFTPHITLAKLTKGKGEKYLNNENLRLILNDSKISMPGDIVLSIGPTGGIDRERYNLTTYGVVDYYFYVENLKKEVEENIEE